MAMKILSALITGLAQGSMIALVALGYTMVYGILKLINFAHSEVFMMGAYAGLFLIGGLGGESSPLFAGVIGTLGAMCLAGALGAAQRVTAGHHRRVHRAGRGAGDAVEREPAFFEQAVEVGIERDSPRGFVAGLPGGGQCLREDFLAFVDLCAQQLQVGTQIGVAGMREFRFMQHDGHRR